MKRVPESLYPFEGKTAQIAGLRLHYLDEGQGEPVVMLHGNPTWSFYYRELVKALRPDYRVLAPDHIGCGLSEKPSADRYPYTLGQRIADIEELLRQLGLTQNLTLVLHDWGGLIGMGVAARHPEWVRRIVLLNTAAFHKPADMKLPGLLWLVRDTALGALLVRRLNFFARGATKLAIKRKPMSRQLADAYCAPYDTAANRIGTLRFVQDIPLKPGDPSFDVMSEVQEGLSQFCEHPILICWGGKDFVFNERILQEFEQRLPNAEVHRFPDAGHYVLEDAGDEIIPLVKAFLTANPLQENA